MRRIIYILTIHHIPNFGSELQAYALQRFLDENHFYNIIIDYRPEYFKTGRNKIKALIKDILFFASNKRIQKKCETFIRSNMRLTNKTYFNYEELSNIESSDEDVFIAGGDQLWNSYHPCGNDNAYKLVFVKNGTKISYGTSIGRNNLDQNEIDDLVLKIVGFDSIGLREVSTVEMLKGRGLKNLYNAVDPVLLLDQSKYIELMKKPAINVPYALFYMIKESELVDDMVSKAKKNHLQIVQVGGRRKECDCDIRLLELSADEMLGLIINASCVVSSSFHATIFSVMLNMPFYTLLPNMDTNARIEDFLGQLGLHNQIIRERKDVKTMPPSIDFSEPNNILKKHIQVSKEKLLTALDAATITKK